MYTVHKIEASCKLPRKKLKMVRVERKSNQTIHLAIMETYSTSKDLCTEEQFYLVLALEYYDNSIQHLEKEQQMIWRRGALSPQQEMRLDEIEAELAYWAELREEALIDSACSE